MTRVKIQTVEDTGTTGQVFIRDTASVNGGAYGASGGGGTVTVSAGGVDNNIAVFSGATSIDGGTDFTHNSTSGNTTFAPTTPTADVVNITAGTLATTKQAFEVTATVPNSGVIERAAIISIAASGSGAGDKFALLTELTGSWTGPGAAGRSVAGQFENSTAGTGTGFWDNNNQGGNHAVEGSTAGTTAGHNVGVLGRASQGSTFNVGVGGSAAFNQAGTLIGVAGVGNNSTGTRVGGYFTTADADPSSLSNVGLGCSNGTTSDNIFQARDNNTPVLTLADGALMGIGSTAAAAPLSTLDVSGSAGFIVTTHSSDITLTAAHHTVLVDATGGNKTVTLPAVPARRTYTIKKIDSTANTVTIDGNASEVIDGATTQVLTLQWQSITIEANGTAWFIT